MKKIATATVALVTVAGLSGGAAVSSSTAPSERTHGAAHTKRFVLTTLASKQLNQKSFAGTDRIRSRRTGEVVGFDSFTGVFDRRTRTVRIWVGIALRGGVINGRVVAGEDQDFTGRITGGTGRYRGITGTIVGREARDKTFVTLRYIL